MNRTLIGITTAALLFSGGPASAQTKEKETEELRAEVKRRAFRPAVEACRIVPGILPGTAGVVGAIATFKAQKLGEV